MACAGVHRASASTVRVRRPPSLPGVVGCFVANTINGKFPLTVLAAVHSGFLRTKLRKRAHALAERGTVQHSNRLVVASRPHRAPHADSVGVRLARWIFPYLGCFPESGFHVATKTFRPLDYWAKVPGSRSTAADYVQRLRAGPPLGEYGTQMCVIRLSTL